MCDIERTKMFRPQTQQDPSAARLETVAQFVANLLARYTSVRYLVMGVLVSSPLMMVRTWWVPIIIPLIVHFPIYKLRRDIFPDIGTTVFIRWRAFGRDFV